MLGLFDESHCKYNYEIDGISDTAPTLSEMTDKAIKILSTNKNGYFLFVEGGRIDHAHHDTFAHIALDETRQFSRTIGMAQSMVDADDTLIVVTADHGHTMTYSGYGVYVSFIAIYQTYVNNAITLITVSFYRNAVAIFSVPADAVILITYLS